MISRSHHNINNVVHKYIPWQDVSNFSEEEGGFVDLVNIRSSLEMKNTHLLVKPQESSL